MKTLLAGIGFLCLFTPWPPTPAAQSTALHPPLPSLPLAAINAVTSCDDTAQKPLPRLAATESLFCRLEIEAYTDLQIWREYLTGRLTSFLDSAATKIPPGTYTATVRFTIEKDGCISEAASLNGSVYGLGKALEDAAREGPQWKPAEINGRAVRSRRTQPVTFLIEADDKEADTLNHAPFVSKPNECGTDTSKALSWLL